MRRRRGYSLLELLIVLAVGTAMLMVAVSVLYMLKETQENVRRRLHSGRMITRLAEQFREDVHKAEDVERVSGKDFESGATVWRLTISPDMTVRYVLGKEEVHRAETSSDKTIREDFRLPQGMRAVLVPSEQGSTIAALWFMTEGAGNSESRPIRVEAQLGFDNRHATENDRATK